MVLIMEDRIWYRRCRDEVTYHGTEIGGVSLQKRSERDKVTESCPEIVESEPDRLDV